MTNNHHINSLVTRHKNLNSQIRSYSKHPCPDSLMVKSLKQQKLYIKDMIFLHSRSSQ